MNVFSVTNISLFDFTWPLRPISFVCSFICDSRFRQSIQFDWTLCNLQDTLSEWMSHDLSRYKNYIQLNDYQRQINIYMSGIHKQIKRRLY